MLLPTLPEADEGGENRPAAAGICRTGWQRPQRNGSDRKSVGVTGSYVRFARSILIDLQV